MGSSGSLGESLPQEDSVLPWGWRANRNCYRGASAIQTLCWGCLWKSEDSSLGLCLKEIQSWPQHSLPPPAASLQTRCLTASGTEPRLDVIKCDLPSYPSSLFLFFIKSLCLPLATWSETMTHLFINSSTYILLSHSLLLYILCLYNFHN